MILVGRRGRDLSFFYALTRRETLSGFNVQNFSTQTLRNDSPSCDLRQRATDRVDSLILVWVRISLAIAVYVWADQFLQDEKWKSVFLDARIQLKYDGLRWVGLWPGTGMYWHFVVVKLAAIGLAIGLLTRFCAAVIFAAIAYVLVVDCSIYVNHYYLLSITSGLLVFLPVGGQWSVDRLLGIESDRTTFWLWQLWLLRFQLGIPYFFGAIAKLNGDWMKGQPAGLILHHRTDWFGKPWSDVPGTVELFVYGGFAYDLFVVPMLLWRRTRLLAVVWSIAFHLTNAMILDIGVFPWFMLATLIVFYPAETLRRRLRLFLGQSPPHCERSQEKSETSASCLMASATATTGRAIAMIYVTIQLLLPLRPALYPGDANWNGRGHRFAWRMMLQHKVGLTHFLVTDKNSDDFLFVPSTVVLTDYQSMRADHDPELVRQTAVAISRAAAELGVPENRVYALALVSLNGRRPRPIVDPTVDLTAVERGWWRDDWVAEDPGPFLDPPWMADKDQWWSLIELPEPFEVLQGRRPDELQSYLKQIGNENE